MINLHGVVKLQDVNQHFVRENNFRLPFWLVKIALYLLFKPLTTVADIVVVHGDIFKQYLISDYQVPSKKIRVRELGLVVNTAIIQEKARKILGIALTHKVVLFQGFLNGYKGLNILIDAFSLIQDKDPNYFLLIGSCKTPAQADNKDYVELYNNTIATATSTIHPGQFLWIGSDHLLTADELIIAFSASDVVVFPYLNRISSSGPMTQSLSLGKPFLASDVFSDFIVNKDWLFERNARSLANQIVYFFDHVSKYREYTQELQHSLLWSTIALKYIEDYKNLTKK